MHSIMIGTPCYGGLVTQAYMLSVLKLAGLAAQKGFDLNLTLLGHDSLVPRARSTIVAKFLDAPDATHLLFIDADIGFEPDQVWRLLCADKEFAAAFYPIKAIDWASLPSRTAVGEAPQFAGLNYVGTLEQAPRYKEEGSFGTAIYAGGGFQLLSRSMVRKLVSAYPEKKYASIQAFADAAPGSDNLYAIFDPVIDPQTGIYLSEDYSFCHRWRAIGGEIWLDLQSRLTHIGSADFPGDTTRRFVGNARGT
jgi:hypothetical protein